MVLPHYMGRSRVIDIESNAELKPKDICRRDSFSSQSPVEDIPLLLPLLADGLDTANIDSHLNGLDKHQNQHDLDQPNRIGQRFSLSLRKTIVEPLVPVMTKEGFVDDLDSTDLQSAKNVDATEDSDSQISDECSYTQERGRQDVSADEISQVGPRSPCRCQVFIQIFCIYV